MGETNRQTDTQSDRQNQKYKRQTKMRERASERERERESTLLHKDKDLCKSRFFTNLSLMTNTVILNTSNKHTINRDKLNTQTEGEKISCMIRQLRFVDPLVSNSRRLKCV